MATKAIDDRGRLAEQVRHSGLTGYRPTDSLRPVLSMIGLGTLVMAVYGTVLFAAAVIIGGLVAMVPGLAGAVVLFTVGVAAISAAPSIAHWTVIRIFELSH